MAHLAEVHQDDVGTKYRGRVMDQGGDFDPTTATVKLLIFKMPGGTTLEKSALVEIGAGDELGQFFLVYTVTANAGSPGSPSLDAFHDVTGAFQVQAYLQWADGKQYHSSVQTVDIDGNELRVHRNLT